MSAPRKPRVTYPRTKLGPRFSEATKAIWLLMVENEWSLADVADKIGAPKNYGYVARWLYGDRIPNLDYGDRFKDALGIDPKSWKVLVTDFTLPAARLRAAAE